jgi:hypothetical protein
MTAMEETFGLIRGIVHFIARDPTWNQFMNLMTVKTSTIYRYSKVAQQRQVLLI